MDTDVRARVKSPITSLAEGRSVSVLVPIWPKDMILRIPWRKLLENLVVNPKYTIRKIVCPKILIILNVNMIITNLF